MSGVYLNIQSSLLKYCKDFITVNGLSSTFEVFDFDAHATINELPNNNLLGIGEYTIRNEDNTYVGEVTIAVCTLGDDINMTQLSPTVDKLFTALRPGEFISSVETSTGDIIGKLRVRETVAVMPVAASKARPIVQILVPFASTLLVPP